MQARRRDDNAVPPQQRHHIGLLHGACLEVAHQLLTGVQIGGAALRVEQPVELRILKAPGRTAQLTPSTARNTPRGVVNSMLRSSTASNAGTSAAAGALGALIAVAAIISREISLRAT